MGANDRLRALFSYLDLTQKIADLYSSSLISLISLISLNRFAVVKGQVKLPKIFRFFNVMLVVNVKIHKYPKKVVCSSITKVPVEDSVRVTAS